MSRATVALRRPQSGVGLVEVLIAALVLSFGLLGLAQLQVWSLKNNQSAMERSMAVMQMYSIVDSMRADRAAAVDNGFEPEPTSEPESGTSFPSAVLSTWRANLVDVLGPDATGTVECDGADCTVRVSWNDRRGTAGNAQQEISTEVRL